MKKTSQSGFTMTELIVAIVLFAVAIPSVAILADMLARLSDGAADTLLANSIAENKVESLRSKGFNGVTNGTTVFSGELPQSLPSPRSASYVVSSEGASLKSITISISYGTQQTEYKTYLGELGVGQY